MLHREGLIQKFSIDHTYTFDLTKVEFCNTDIILFILEELENIIYNSFFKYQRLIFSPGSL